MIDKDQYKYLTTISLPELNNELEQACCNGDLDLVRYILTSPDFKKNADIHFSNELSLHGACTNGNLEIVKYLLTSPELKEHANVRAHNNYAVCVACAKGHLDIVKYLLTSPELKEKADFTKSVPLFINAYNDKQLHILQYLIFELNIVKSPEIKEHMENFPKDIYDTVKMMFSKRELNENLNSKLLDQNTNKIIKKNKL